MKEQQVNRLSIETLTVTFIHLKKFKHLLDVIWKDPCAKQSEAKIDAGILNKFKLIVLDFPVFDFNSAPNRTRKKTRVKNQSMRSIT